ncbi:Hypothetical predicted protein [Mytilus galloprovincialis]|uniref:Mitochondria-eating protein C-terminal domain-containing protein n=1 Tax=Mytilus galloprovincialis TaxID=29158 RepID=A0A8B6HD22_MYTGA|nr:Hypothetical predicted protein [Mytilus galloprovincialis]
MSLLRLPHRRSTRKRKFELVSPKEETPTELNYDGVKNAITDIENVLNDMRKKVKQTKKVRVRENSFEAAKQYMTNLHSHIQFLNESFGVRFPEVVRLEKELRQLEDALRIVENDKSELERKVKEWSSVKKEQTTKLQEKEYELQVCREKTQEQAKKLHEIEYELQVCREKTQEREKELQKQENEQDARFAEQLQGKERIIEGQKITITRLEDQIKTKDNDIESLKQGQEMRNAVQEELQTKESEILKLKDTNEREKQMIVDHYKETIQNKEREIHRMQVDLQRKENTVQQLLKQRDEEKAAKEDERKQKDEALTRLSAIAGDRLRNNNPGITDLSDPNRPMKIAEKFTEMYDNDWTDSMEALEDLGLNEEECVIMLLHFLTDSYEECGKLVAELDRHIEQAVTLTHCEQDGDKSGESSSSSQNIPPEILKPIKDIRRKMTVNNMEILQKKLLDHLKIVRMDVKDDHISACSKFVADCIKYAWMMQIQDPPVYIEWDFPSDTKIDTNILRSYTKAGDQVDFIVWPVLYLHKDGPVLNKGVVQPKSK